MFLGEDLHMHAVTGPDNVWDDRNQNNSTRNLSITKSILH